LTHQEPGRLEVLLTLLAGRLAGNVYRQYVDRLELRGNERVLDFGSGAGNPARYLAGRLKAGGRLTCVDISTVWQQVIRRRLGKYSNVEFRLGDIRTLDIPDGSQDVIFIHFVLHDIPAGERPSTVQALVRTLAPGGKVYVREPLRFISGEEVRTLLGAAGLHELSARTVQVKTQGSVYEAVYSGT